MEKNPINTASLSDPSPEIFPIEEEEEDFEFSFSTESDPLSFPLFNRNLIPMNEIQTLNPRSSSNSSSSSSDSQDPVRLSTSAPDLFPKSRSTGSSPPRKWKLRDLVVGRSRSDGKDRFLVVGFPDQKVKSGSVDLEKKEKKGKGEVAKEMDIVTAHRIYYGKSGAAGGPTAAPVSHRRSFLPYRQELLGGIFGNAKHHHHPF